MLKEILAVSGKSGLYRLVSRGKNLLIIESLADKKRVPAYARDKVISLGDISIYTDEDEVSIREVLTSIKEKENGKNISIDLSKAGADELRAYLAEVLPNFDRERVYPSDIKKLLKWYEILIADGITDFSVKEDEEAVANADEVKEDVVESSEDGKEKKAAKPKAASKTTKAASTKRKDSSMTASAKATKAKPTAKTVTPKKSTVGAKRGG
jgi:hypothetical protein